MHHPHTTAPPSVRRRTGRTARTAAGLALLPALVVAGAGPAAAHDELIRTAPAMDETTASAPDQVTLTFSGELIDGQGIQNLVQVRDADGNQWQAGPGTVAGSTFSAPVCAGLPNGDFQVAYRVVYSDGHSEERSFGFTVDDPAAPAAGTAPEDCGVVAAAPPAASSPGASSASAAAPTQAQDATAADAQPEQDAAETAESGVLPAWVWVAGVAGLLVLLVGGLLVGRRARALGHVDGGR